MGNSQSSVRSDREAAPPRHLVQHVDPGHAPSYLIEPPAQSVSPTRSLLAGDRRSMPSDLWNRHSHRTSMNVEDGPYEPEDRPLFHSNHDPPVELHPERPPNWRHSTMSRLGSRLLPDSVARSLTNSGEESPEEGQALRNGLLSRSRPSVHHRRITSVSNERFSITGSFRRRPVEARRERDSARRSIMAFLAPSADRQPIRSQTNSLPDANGHTALAGDEIPIRERPRRLGRVRHSLSLPFGNVLAPFPSRRIQSPPLRPARIALTEESDELLSQPRAHEQRPDNDDVVPHELDAAEPETRNLLSSSRITSGMSTIRRFPHGLRSRSTRLIRRGEHPPLSQVLQLAAAAIAAQLSGTSINGTDGNNQFGADGFDGSIQNFVQTLQEAASAQAGQDIDLNASDGELPPVNFMRVFQFPNDENGTPLAAQAHRRNGLEAVDDQTQDHGDRSVTLVLVGVRSMPNIQDGTTNENGTLGPSLDTLLSLPFLPPANVLRNGSSGALFRRSDTRVRPQNRRHSMTNFNFPQQYESQRHARSRNSGSRSQADHGNSMPNHNLLTPASESPPGPNPPPSTPADMRSGNASPSRRPSATSVAHGSGLPNVNEDQDNDTTPLPAESAFNTARQRRRSDSEFARRPELSSGNSRRNGVVEPDRPVAGAGRSWLIYVVGTNVSPDHPAFTMPSLFTDNPSYEDMQMLSTLLGPVKPPVATQQDVDSAGGLYRVLMRGGMMMAEAAGEAGQNPISIDLGDRCLVCLCEYEEGEQVRQINTCRHVYHRECIDEVSCTAKFLPIVPDANLNSGSLQDGIVAQCVEDKAFKRTMESMPRRTLATARNLPKPHERARRTMEVLTQ